MQHVKQLGALGGALVLTAGLASAATAAEWSMKVHGFFNAGVIVSNLDDGYQGKSVYTNPEIFFSPSIKMDNGVTYGARVELEGYTTSDQIDEHYLYVKGGFGTVKLGAEDGAHYNLHSEAPGGGFDNYNDPSYVATYGGINTSDYSSSDSNGIIYMSPSFSGVEFGLSYKPDTTAGGGNNLTGAKSVPKTDGDYGDAIALGVKYSTTMDTFSLGVSGGYQTLSADAENGTDRDVMVASLSVGFGGITIGGSYKDDDLGDDSQDQQVYNLGVKYTAGDVTFGGGMGVSTTETKADGVTSEAEKTNASVSMTYKLGPGIKVGGGLQFEDNDAEADEAYGIVVGLGLSF